MPYLGRKALFGEDVYIDNDSIESLVSGLSLNSISSTAYVEDIVLSIVSNEPSTVYFITSIEMLPMANIYFDKESDKELINTLLHEIVLTLNNLMVSEMEYDTTDILMNLREDLSSLSRLDLIDKLDSNLLLHIELLIEFYSEARLYPLCKICDTMLCIKEE